jgi:putative transcriptional regulator
MLKYKFDILSALKAKGYNTHLIRKEKILSEATLQKFRQGEAIGADNLNRLCRLLDCQPGDILEYIPDTNSKRIE